MNPTAAASAWTAQVWIEHKSDDPEAVSALEVARGRLAAGSALRNVRRLRLIEIHGALPARETLSDLLHRSTRFYNPHKERCTLRLAAGDPTPVMLDEQAVLVTERGGERRNAAERWWLHETDERVIVREGVVWAMEFAPGTVGAEALAELTWARDRAHGLLCNPNSQDGKVANGKPPFPWLTEDSPAVVAGGQP